MRHVIGVVIVMSTVAGSAYAQSNAIAEQLFNEGRDLAAAGKWSEACPKFEASMQRDPALGTRLNLATCYQHVNKLASAWGLFRDSADIAKKANDTKRFDYAMQQAAALEPKLPKLVITAPPKAPVGLTVQRDGAAVSAAELGVALYVDPGAHEVTASAPGFEPVTSKVTAEEGKTETLVLPELKAKPDVQQPPATDKDTDDVSTEPISPTRKYVALGIGGGGIAMVGVGLVFGAQAISKNNKAKDLCGSDLSCSGANLEAGQQLIHDGRTRGTLSTVFVAAGVAAIGGGVVVYLTAPRTTERTHATARIVPIIDRDGAGLGMVGRF
jgi:hypothetical protein